VFAFKNILFRGESLLFKNISSRGGLISLLRYYLKRSQSRNTYRKYLYLESLFN
jgi:hypothetical protein